MIRAAAAIAAALAASPAAGGTVLRSNDWGGDLDAARFRMAALPGPVAVDAVCNSACTVVLRRRDVCATARARFGFHAPYRCQVPVPPGRFCPPRFRATDASAAAALLSSYPPGVRAWLAARGGLTPRKVWLAGAALRAVVPSCR